MGGKKLMVAVILAAASQPCFASDAYIGQGAAYSQAGTAAPTPQAGRTDNAIRGMVVASSMAGALEITGAFHKQREVNRLIPAGGTAEAALLAGAGLLSPAPHLHPPCFERDRDLPFHCQISRKRDTGR